MHTQLTPNAEGRAKRAERALLAYLESALVHDEFTRADPWPTQDTSHYAPLDFNRPMPMPTLPDWADYHAVDDFDLYLYH